MESKDKHPALRLLWFWELHNLLLQEISLQKGWIRLVKTSGNGSSATQGSTIWRKVPSPHFSCDWLDFFFRWHWYGWQQQSDPKGMLWGWRHSLPYSLHPPWCQCLPSPTPHMSRDTKMKNRDFFPKKVQQDKMTFFPSPNDSFNCYIISREPLTITLILLTYLSSVFVTQNLVSLYCLYIPPKMAVAVNIWISSRSNCLVWWYYNEIYEGIGALRYLPLIQPPGW